MDPGYIYIVFRKSGGGTPVLSCTVKYKTQHFMKMRIEKEGGSLEDYVRYRMQNGNFSSFVVCPWE